jgi:heme-degrading monooxygenase HmoA
LVDVREGRGRLVEEAVMAAEPSILRVFRARVKPGREDQWDRLLDAQIKHQLVGVEGLIAWHRGRPTGYGEQEFVAVTIWPDKDAVRRWAGASAGPVMLGGQHELADSVSVEQFELDE